MPLEATVVPAWHPHARCSAFSLDEDRCRTRPRASKVLKHKNSIAEELRFYGVASSEKAMLVKHHHPDEHATD